MKVIIHQDCKTAFGWVNAFLSRSDQVVVWHQSVKPTFDLFNEFEPDLLVCDLANIDSALRKCLNRFQTKAKIILPAYGTKRRPELDYATIPQRRVLDNLLNTNVSYLSFYPPEYLNKWKETTAQPLTIHLPCVDSTVYAPTDFNAEYACDLAIVEDYKPIYKKAFDKANDGKRRVVVYANGWNIPECVGKVNEDILPSVFASAKNVLVFDEFHGLKEKVAACGGTALYGDGLKFVGGKITSYIDLIGE